MDETLIVADNVETLAAEIHRELDSTELSELIDRLTNLFNGDGNTVVVGRQIDGF